MSPEKLLLGIACSFATQAEVYGTIGGKSLLAASKGEAGGGGRGERRGGGMGCWTPWGPGHVRGQEDGRDARW